MRISTEAKLFCFGCFCALIQIPLGLDAVGFGSPYEASTVAANLAATGEFRDPFGVASGPTAHVSPVYPFLLALLIRVFRQPDLVIYAAVLLNACLLGLAAALLPRLSDAVFHDARPGVAGGILLALSGRLMPQWEVALSALLLLAAASAVLFRTASAGGLFTGFSLLTNPVSLPALAVLAWSRGARYAVAVFAFAIALCAPWLIRNWMVLGAPYFIRDNFGLELHISNNDQAGPDLASNQALWTLHPNQSREQAAVVASMGEVPYNRARLAEAVEWIRAHPARFLRLSTARVFYYWFPPLQEGWTAYPVWLMTALAAIGTWIARRQRTVLLIAAAAVAYSLPFVVIQTVGRYRFPSLWMSALLAGYAAHTLYLRGRSILTGRDL